MIHHRKLLLLALTLLTLNTATPAATPATSPAPQPLLLPLSNTITLKLLPIPAGTFLMGSPDTEKGHSQLEPQRQVTLSPFFMGETLITVDQFAAFVADSHYQTEAEKDGRTTTFGIRNGNTYFTSTPASWRKPNPTLDQKSDHPVLQVSWNDTQAFCQWLSKKTGTPVTLPTDAQWEYACRAGTKTPYPWLGGTDKPDDAKGLLNANDQSLIALLPNTRMVPFTWNDSFVFTSPVTAFKPNPYGLYDIPGNASQWCQDYMFSLDHPFDNAPVTDPAGPPTGTDRIQRGASWYGLPPLCRSAYRDAAQPASRDDRTSFRIVVNPTTTPPTSGAR